MSAFYNIRVTLRVMLKQFTNYLSPAIQTSELLETSNLPPWINSVLDDYLGVLCHPTPKEALLVALNAKLAQVLSLDRFKVQTLEGSTLCNYYGMVFMPSGSGKDRPLDLLDKYLLPPFEKEFGARALHYRETATEAMLRHVEATIKSKPAQDAYITKYGPSWLVSALADATPEGFYTMRSELQKAGFGGTFLRISEFGDYIGSDSNIKGGFLSSIIQVYEEGDSDPKIIKSEKDTIGIRNVPSNALLHTSLSGLRSGAGKDRLMKFLNGGGARRYFVAYPRMGDPKEEQGDVIALIKDRKKKTNRAIALTFKLQDRIKQVINIKDTTWKLSPEAEEMYLVYHEYNKYRQQRLRSNEGVAATISSLHRKALKLAGVIAAFEHPNVTEVAVDDIYYAVYQCEVYLKHFERFYEGAEKVEFEHLYELIKSSGGITKMGIRRRKLVADRDFARWFDDALESCRDLAAMNGMRIVVKGLGKRGHTYTLETIEKTKLQKIKLSVSKQDITTGYEPHYVAWDKVSDIVNGQGNYSPSEFKDGYRTSENYIDGNNIIVLDIDDGWTIEQAQHFLYKEGLKSLICTTKSHQVTKGEKPACDRFRILIPVLSPFRGTKEQFSYMSSQIFRYFDNKPDAATKDATRFYYGNPKGESIYINGERLLDLGIFPTEEPRRKYNVQGHWRDNDDYTRITEYFIREATEGHRNNILYRAYRFFLDEKEDAEKRVREINLKLISPLNEKELKAVIREK